MAPYQGTLVLHSFEVVLLKDVVESDDDFYWVYFGMQNDAFIEYHESCVTWWTPLKGVIPNQKYSQMLDVWNLNFKGESAI